MPESRAAPQRRNRAQRRFRTRFQAVELKYFEDIYTLYIEFGAGDFTELRDLDENTLMDLYADGNTCAITFEHARQRTDVRRLTVEGIAAW